MLLLYVDDIILTGSSVVLLDQLISNLKSTFAMKDMGSLHYFLGIAVSLSSDGLFLSQRKYVEDILERTNMLAARAHQTPLSQKHGLHESVGPSVDPSEFRSVVGALQYLTLTRPEISHAVNLLCQFMQSPTENHWTGVKRILRYIAETLHLGLRITSKLSLQFVGFSDADWTSFPLTPIYN